MASIKFSLRSTAKKPIPIYLYLSHGRGKMIRARTGFLIAHKDWSDKTNLPSQNNSVNKKLINDLKKLESFLLDKLNEDSSKGIDISSEWVNDKIRMCFGRIDPKNSDTVLLTHQIEHIIEHANTRRIVGSQKVGLSKRRVTGYGTFLGLVLRYEKHLKRKIKFSDINKTLLEKFTKWLLSEQNYSINYAGKQLDNLKTVCNDARKSGIEVNPFAEEIRGFSETKKERSIVTLSFEELDQIISTPLQRQSLINARKWLILGCELGQRAGDLLKILPEDVRIQGEMSYIDVDQQKTGKTVTLPIVSPQVSDILENDFPTTLSTQKLNIYLKELCKEAGIDEPTEGKKLNPSSKRKEKGIYPKHELISTHVCRRSFASNYYKKMPTAVLMEITGHSKESMFLDYINKPKDKDENAKLFASFYESIHKPNEPLLRVS